MKYCIFGGAFDPPHHGHLYLAQSACSLLGFDRIFWVPTPDPPHKNKPGTPFIHRLAMVKHIVANQPKFEASDIECHLSRPSYSLNMIHALKAKYGSDHTWHFLIGADNWAIFPTWYQSEEVLKAVTMVVFPREGYPLGEIGSIFPPGVLRLELPEMHIQSRGIRESLALDSDLTLANVHEAIRPYIQLHHLYGVGAE